MKQYVLRASIPGGDFVEYKISKKNNNMTSGSSSGPQSPGLCYNIVLLRTGPDRPDTASTAGPERSLVYPRSNMTQFDRFRGEIGDLSTQGRLYEPGRGWILAHSELEESSHNMGPGCVRSPPELGIGQDRPTTV